MALSLRFIVAQAYSRLYGFLKNNFNIHIRGLGFLLRRIKEDQLLYVNGRALYFSRRFAEAYARPICGHWNEPETHSFILYLMDRLNVVFVDVGANIGEILIDAAAQPSCIKAFAFEPNPEAVEIIKRNIRLNSVSGCTVCCKALGHEKLNAKMSLGSHSEFLSATLVPASGSSGNGIDVEISTLDFELTPLVLPGDQLILLIDVEGFELNVIRGGRDIISNLRPLIIFEYHQKTQKVFHIADLRDELGEAYEIYRLRQDAMLDRKVHAAWNCVAVPRGSDFEHIVSAKILEQI